MEAPLDYVCQYCGRDTSTVEYDYLVGTDHLSCYLEKVKTEWETSIFTIPADMVKNTPNDSELGNKVRQIYNDLKK
jgi:hypothetical protein